MDTFQWLDAAFSQYKSNHSISSTKAYSSLCEESNELIDFVPPNSFSFRLDSTYSPVLSKSVSLKLPGNALRLGFIHQSPSAGKKSSSSSKNGFFGPYFMYGQVSSLPVTVPSTSNHPTSTNSSAITTAASSASLEAYYAQRISTHGNFSFSSSLLHHNHFRSSFTWYFPGPRTSATWSYCSMGRILGWQGLKHFRGPRGSAWKGSWGGEVYYTAQENSGGISMGFRLESGDREVDRVEGDGNGNSTADSTTSSNTSINTDLSNPSKPSKANRILTLTGNPLMGHYRCTLTAPILFPGLLASSRYDINLHSFDSDLSAGFSYALGAGLIKVAAGGRGGVSFVLQTAVGEGVKVRVGVRVGRQDTSFGLDFVIRS